MMGIIYNYFNYYNYYGGAPVMAMVFHYFGDGEMVCSCRSVFLWWRLSTMEDVGHILAFFNLSLGGVPTFH